MAKKPLISGGYKQVRQEDLPRLLKALDGAWKDPSLPQRQWEMAVEPEMREMKAGRPCPAFRAFGTLVTEALKGALNLVRILEVGAGGGQYYGLLRHWQGDFPNYVACDYSPAFRDFAVKKYPGLRFDVADARALPYKDGEFRLTVEGCTLIHVPEGWGSVVRECARVTEAGGHVLFHRTPFSSGPAKVFTKEAYGVPCIEQQLAREVFDAVTRGAGLVKVSEIDLGAIVEGGSMTSSLWRKA